MAVKSNRELLTGGKKYVQKKARNFGVDEVVFDKDSRHEYLTGFHKRKLERQKKAQVYNKEQERLARIEERKQLREERKNDMEKQLKRFNETVKEITSYQPGLAEESNSEDEWDGFKETETLENTEPVEDEENNQSASDNEQKEKKLTPNEKKQKGILQHKEIYTLDNNMELPESNVVLDEETTVTVESLDNPLVDNIREANLEAIARANNVDLNKSDKILEDSIKRAKNYAVVCGVAKPKDKVKQKKKKFRYLTKAERRENVRKERSSKKRPSKTT